MNGPILLEADNLSYTPGGSNSGRLLVDSVSLSLHQREIVGITGPNGAGKSTLLKLLSGFIEPVLGEVRYGDRRLTALKHRERAVYAAFMSQKGPDTFPFSVAEIVEMGRYPHLESARHPGKTERETALSALESLGLGHLADRSYTTLSGGEQQLVLFAQILVQNTPVLLLDEPTASLDIGHETQLLQVVRNLCRKGSGAVIAMHNLNSAAEYCDRILLMHQGKVVSEGKPHEVFTEHHLKKYYHTDVRLGTNEATGSLVVTALPQKAAICSLHVHLIGGAGSAVAVTRMLFLLGCRITGGVAHELDSDTKIWRSLGVECITVPAFAEIDDESYRKAEELTAAADLTILCEFPAGPGNLANLKLAGTAGNLIILDDDSGDHAREFFSEEAQELFNVLAGTHRRINREELTEYLYAVSEGSETL